MGRLIDADVLREEVYSWGMNDYEPSDFTDAIDDTPTIEAIPKSDYEARLKGDLVAMLTEIQTEIKEMDSGCGWEGYRPTAQVIGLIQQKINELKEDQGGE